MIQDGHATSLTIAPNLPKPQDLQLVHDAMVLARRRRRGLWAQARPVLHGFEYRWIVDTLAGKRQGPDRYCGDFGSGRLYAPQQYYKVPEERRLWFFGEGLGEAMKMGFRLQL
jgi:hypothetical protein